MKKNENPIISVVMSVRNEQRFIDEAIQSILDQTYDDFEFIIIDDASTDTTSSILDRYQNIDKRIIVLRNEENQGALSKCLNKGIRQAKGRYIARMDGDDIAHRQRFEKQIRAIEKDSSCALIGSWCHEINEKGVFIRSLCFPTEHRDLQKALAKYNPFIHPSIMVRKNVLNKVGLYNEHWVTGAEDYELYFRIAQHYLMMNLGEFLIAKRIRHQSITYQQGFAMSCLTLKIRIQAMRGGQSPFAPVVVARSILSILVPSPIKIFLKHTLARFTRRHARVPKEIFWQQKR